MWRPNSQIHLFSQQTGRELYPTHWSTVEQANGRIGFQNGQELDLQQSNIPGINLFPNGLQHVPPANSGFYDQQMAQIPPSIASNFGSQIVLNHGFLSVFNESAMKGVKRKGEDDYKYVY